MCDKIKIDKGIPVPETRGRIRKYPWDEMEIDDSFLVSLKTKNISGYTFWANKRYAPKRFTGRKMPDGHRIWRIE